MHTATSLVRYIQSDQAEASLLEEEDCRPYQTVSRAFSVAAESLDPASEAADPCSYEASDLDRDYGELVVAKIDFVA